MARDLTRTAQSPRVFAVVSALLVAACGSPDPAPAAPQGEPAGAPKAAVEQAATPGPGAPNHAIYAARAIGCAECHACGKREPNGHAVAWMDVASPGFHAFAANQDLASCQACHGANLDGAGGTTSISCARCHGATWRTTCTGCHGGTDSQTGAPPRTVWGRSAETLRVGTHTAHLAATHGLSSPVACATCHVVPADALSAGHANGPTADVTFSGLAAQGVAASWNRTAGTCTTYCHGATLGGGTLKTPVFTDTSGAARACGACHGAPPPSPHLARTDCGTCHLGYTATTVNLSTHVDGKVDAVALACTTCHGQAGRGGVAGADPNQAAAPPVDTAGSATGAKVGAHLAHVNRNGLSVAWSCATCHGTQDASHPSGGATKITFTGVAGATSTYANGTCATYCHAQGGATPTPGWTGAAMSCASCHAATPPAPHVQRTDCGTCHTGYTATTVNAATHVNGTVNVNSLACNTCHGSATNAAPPVGTRGETLTSTRAVGAHQKHLLGGSIGAAMACTECHAVPTAMNHADVTVQLAWGPVARAGGANPSFVTTNLSCSSTYCHGATLAAGGTNQAPVWTGGAAQASCGTCHGSPPPAPHTANTACGSCHTGYTATSVNLATHVNGTVNVVPMTCTSCHGKAGQAATPAAPLNAAPPVDAAGASTGIRVGAHQKHLVGGAYANAFSCATCHASVGTYTNSHPNNVREVGFTGAANANLRKGTWRPGTGTAAGTCASTWCHGAVISRSNGPVGGTLTTPAWTSAVAACTSCHAVATTSLSGRHNSPSEHRRYACSVCHGTGYTATVSNNVATGTGVNKAAHVDGVRTIVTVASGTGIRTWNPTTRTCTASCHGSETW